ncbi:MAG: hypothetical protein JO325_11365 [Solirubrobacterales bacterium]|nr:hypothetical protein [Solirubrobacterales bacterium]
MRADDLGPVAELDAGLIVSSNDPRALRLYARAGFALQPTLAAEGEVDRRALPSAHPGIREDDDLEALQARLQLTAYGALCVRGTPGTLYPFLPSAPFA